MAKNTKGASRFGSNVVADVERRKREGSNYGYLTLPKGLNIFKESEGRIHLDIIPYIVTDPNHPDGNPDNVDAANVGNPWYKRPVYVHRSVGADNKSIVCPKTIGKKCPICEHRNKQFQEGVDKDSVVAKAQLKNLYVVIPIGHKQYEEKFHLWDISNGNFQTELDDELGEKPEYGSFPDPAEGYTLNIRFTEETFSRTKYFAANRIDFEEREPYDEKIMEEAPKLDDMLTILSYKDIEMMFFEIDEEDVANEEEEPKKEEATASTFRKRRNDEEKEAPKESPRRGRSQQQKESHPEEEADDDGVEDSGIDEHNPPPRKRKTIKSEEEDKPQEVEEPKRVVKEGMRRRRSERGSPKEETEEKCPHSHKFGVDWDEFDDCDDCKVFEACGKKNEALAEKH